MEQLALTNALLQELETLLKNNLKKQTEESIYLTRKQTAKCLNISLPTLDLYSSQEKIKAHRIGSRILYKHTDIESSLTSYIK